MAVEWGSNSLGPRQSAGWSFARPVASGFLPVISVRPLSPSFTDNHWSFPIGLNVAYYPFFNQLGVSTLWSQLSDDESYLIYYVVVSNFSNSTIEYAFLEADL